MRRPAFSTEEIKRHKELIEKKNFLYKRKRRLYNRKYRKSFIYISTWIVRLIYIALFFIVANNHKKPGGFTDEIVISKEVETYKTRSSRYGPSHSETIIHLKTNRGTYESKTLDVPDLLPGDTLQIERNIFKKPLYFTKPDWNNKYYISPNVFFYFSILFLNVLTFFFNDGLDRFTDKILWIGWTMNILAMVLYFLF